MGPSENENRNLTLKLIQGEELTGTLTMSKKARKKLTAAMREQEQQRMSRRFRPKKILQVGRVTVVFWRDGSTTAVRCSEGEIPDDYAAFCAALGKKVFGTNTALKRAFMDAPHETEEP